MLPYNTNQWVIAFCAVALSAGQQARAGHFIYTSIDVPNATVTYPIGVNDLGEVAGVYEGASDRIQYGFLWANGAITTFAGHVPLNSFGVAGIDNHGRIAFTAAGIRSGSSEAKVRHPGGAYSQLPTPAGQFAWSSAINDGRIAGAYQTGSGALSRTGFVYRQGQLQTLTYPGAALTTPGAIAKDGTVIGTYSNSDADPAHGFIYRDGSYTAFDPPNSTYTLVNSVNRRGDIAGTFYTAGLGTGTLGYVMSHGKYHIYAVKRGKTYVNEARWAASERYVAGDFYNLSNGIAFTFVDGQYYQVLPFGTSNSYIVSGNAQGTLVGIYTGADNLTHGFIAVCPPAQSPCTN